MKIDVTAKLKNLDGTVDENAPSLRDISVRALVETLPSDRNRQSGEEKFKLAELARKILTCDGDVDISVEDAGTIKSRVGEAFPPVIVHSAWSMLEGS